ncbi:hypothetical protein [Photobacterium atrarenae]|uniref:Uncharacterized protein n=1 Tax=Photobacterium atrarenae TaxID=865757 RepID=A0ABY5GEY1_9GAMM|nr:hypothetical protein [Photobacterium atrarenae]UTV27726.1 hypothetical protein NNL38_15850 [Photobacterium atrarenae]
MRSTTFARMAPRSPARLRTTAHATRCKAKPKPTATLHTLTPAADDPQVMSAPAPEHEGQAA